MMTLKEARKIAEKWDKEDIFVDAIGISFENAWALVALNNRITELEAGGGTNIYWSEYEGMIWCYDCKIDIPGFQGIFDGPIPLHGMEIMGISLNRLYFKSNKMFKPIVNKKGRVVYRRCSKKERALFKKIGGNDNENQNG